MRFRCSHNICVSQHIPVGAVQWVRLVKDEPLPMPCCFSLGWYWSIGCMLVTREPYGKRTCLVVFTICGYVLGLCAKLWTWNTGAELSNLIFVYGWNLASASLDLVLVFHLNGKRHSSHPTAIRLQRPMTGLGASTRRARHNREPRPNDTPIATLALNVGSFQTTVASNSLRGDVMNERVRRSTIFVTLKA